MSSSAEPSRELTAIEIPQTGAEQQHAAAGPLRGPPLNRSVGRRTDTQTPCHQNIDSSDLFCQPRCSRRFEREPKSGSPNVPVVINAMYGIPAASATRRQGNPGDSATVPPAAGPRCKGFGRRRKPRSERYLDRETEQDHWSELGRAAQHQYGGSGRCDARGVGLLRTAWEGSAVLGEWGKSGAFGRRQSDDPDLHREVKPSQTCAQSSAAVTVQRLISF